MVTSRSGHLLARPWTFEAGEGNLLRLSPKFIELLQAERDELLTQLKQRNRAGTAFKVGQTILEGIGIYLMDALFDCGGFLRNTELPHAHFMTDGVRVHIGILKATMFSSKGPFDANDVVASSTTCKEVVANLFETCPSTLYNATKIPEPFTLKRYEWIRGKARRVTTTPSFSTSTRDRLSACTVGPRVIDRKALASPRTRGGLPVSVPKLLSAVSDRITDTVALVTIDIGYHTDVAAVIHTRDETGQPVARPYLFQSLELAHQVKRLTTTRDSNIRQRNRLVRDHERSSLRDTTIMKAAHQILDLAGAVPGTALSKVTARPSTVLIGIGGDATHPGKGKGVHRPSVGTGVVRHLIKVAPSLPTVFEFFYVNEHLTSQVCPRPECTDVQHRRLRFASLPLLLVRDRSSEAPNRLIKPKYVDGGDCERVKQCLNCGGVFNRDHSGEALTI